MILYKLCAFVCVWVITVTVNGISNIQLSDILVDNRLAENPFHRMSQNNQCMSRSVNNSFGKYQLENHKMDVPYILYWGVVLTFVSISKFDSSEPAMMDIFK